MRRMICWGLIALNVFWIVVMVVAGYTMFQAGNDLAAAVSILAIMVNVNAIAALGLVLIKR